MCANFSDVVELFSESCQTIMNESLWAAYENRTDSNTEDEKCACMSEINEASAASFDCRYSSSCSCTVYDLWKNCDIPRNMI